MQFEMLETEKVRLKKKSGCRDDIHLGIECIRTIVAWMLQVQKYPPTNTILHPIEC